jgi:hypothetical protein
VSVEVQKIQEVKVSGQVDFWINATKRWAVEFLIRGELENYGVSDAAEHVGRFRGKYAPLSPRESLVVDFRPASYGDYYDITKDELLENYWVVVYNTQEKKSQVVKYDDNKKRISDAIVLMVDQ